MRLLIFCFDPSTMDVRWGYELGLVDSVELFIEDFFYLIYSDYVEVFFH
ncbi:hypothetical protein [Membranihabitans marinus]|nr:hypothetical protein [Membranihabitans marinus]